MGYLIAGYVIFLLGMFCGAVLNPDEDCPARVIGFNCKGDNCDHRKSTLYGNMQNMALQAEKREKEKEINYWGGDKDA